MLPVLSVIGGVIAVGLLGYLFFMLFKSDKL